jgi:hypothetical protein
MCSPRPAKCPVRLIYLTTGYYLARFGPVDCCSQKNGSRTRRLLGAAVLFFVFFLPLHFHFFSPTAQLTQQCSCYHGVRTQAGLASTPTDCTPTFQAVTVETYEPQIFIRLSIYSLPIRAPPYNASL